MPEKLPFEDEMEGEDLATTVLTCEGDLSDPTFPFRLQYLVTKLQHLISDEEKPFKVTKVEPWNSVRVTFNIPQEAAQRLRQLAERGDRVLRELGILSVQIEGDQVITLTLAGQFNEPQEIVLRKSTESQSNVASVSFNLPASEPVPGTSSSEPARKSINQLLGHIVGGATTAAITANTPSRVDATMKSDSSLKFRSPNVIAPTSKEPIPFPPAAVAATATVSTANTSHATSLSSPKQQTGFRPFPFASMTHAMNTKHASTSPQFQSVVHVQSTNSRIAFTTSAGSLVTNSARNASTSPTSPSVTSPSSSGPSQPVVNPVLQKLSRSVPNSIFNNIVSRVTAPNAVAVTSRANVALSSPLLVNLLQSETSTTQPHNKLMPPPPLTSNQAPKRKRKPRKPKERHSEDGNSVSSPTFSASPSPPSTPSSAGLRSPLGFEALNALGHSFNAPITSMPLSPTNHSTSVVHSQMQGPQSVPSIHPHAHIPPTAANIHPQAQGQPPVTLHSQVQMPPVVPSSHRHLQGHQTVPTIHRPAPPGHPSVPNIHPQAEGQPQVHTGNLPLHTHIPVGVPAVSTTTNLQQSYAISGPRGIPISTSRLLFAPNRDNTVVSKGVENAVKENVAVKSIEKINTPPSTSATSTPESNPFPSPPPSAERKTKHLINPFTGQLEPMPPSDEEEEEESIGSLPPFPDFDIDTSENGQSERSLSDGGKDNISSDTDSGISKSHTDISQSSTDCGPVQSSKDNKKPEVAKTESVTPTASVTSGPGEKLKLRLKIDPKTIRESKETEMKERRKENASQFSQRIDVAVVSIPVLKKGGSSLSSMSVAAEPRVPPLHISLRGPNAAVVVSPRKDDLKVKSASKEDHSGTDTVIKSSVKKVRSPRSTRTAELSGVSSLINRISDLSEKRCKGSNLKEQKKAKDDFWNQNVKNMCGGGIVEMTEKTAVNRVTNFATYADRQSVSCSSLQRKSAPTLPVSTVENCKSDIITLTSCSTGETVSIHTAAHAKSQLPSQFSSAAELASLVSVISTRAPTKGLAPHVQITQSLNERTPNSVFSMGNHVQDKTVADYAVSQSQICKDNSLLGARKSPQNMQNIYLPHGPSAQTECKSIVQKTLSDQIQPASASSVSIVSAVPLSSHSISFGTQSVCNVISTLPKEISVFSDLPVKKALLVEKDRQNSSEELKNCATCDRLHTAGTPCNIPSLHLTDTPVENVKSNSLIVSKDIVQNEETFISTLSESLSNNKSVIREVQMNAAINNEQTVNHVKNSDDLPNFNDIESVKKPVVSSAMSVKQVFLEENQVCRSSTFSNHTALCESPVTSCLPVTKREILKDMDASEKGLCIIEVKNPNPPIAQIITMDNLPIQSRVIEVPSLQTSPAVPKTLAKSGLAVEVSSVPSLIPSRCGAFIPSRSVVMIQEQDDVLTVNSQISSDLANRKLLESTNSSGVQKSNALLGSGNEVLFNHVNIRGHVNTECMDSDRTEQNSSTVPSEESSMDSIDEERKHMLLSEVPTSTPGPPKTEQEPTSTSTLCENKMKSNTFNKVCTSSVSSSRIEKPVAEVVSVSQRNSAQDECMEPDSSKTASEDALSEGVSEENPLKDLGYSGKNSGRNEDAKLAESEVSSNCSIQVQPTSTCSPQISEDTPSEMCSRVVQSSSTSIPEHNSSVAEPNTSEMCDAFPTAKSVSLESTSKLESSSIPENTASEDSCKKEPVSSCEQAFAMNTTSSSVVTSLLSQGRYLSPESSTGGRVRLIFKGSGQHSVLSSSSSPTSVVVPLNSTKTVPIKLVTLPGGASGLSVRSTSNPAVVEIIGPKSSSSHSSPSSSNPHPSSPVRLVVSKVSPGVSSVNQTGSSGMRNRVVVKSVVVTGTSSSIKIVSATKGTVCATSPVSPSSNIIATSSSSGGRSPISLPASVVSSSCNLHPSPGGANSVSESKENPKESLVTSSNLIEPTNANQEGTGRVSSTTASEVISDILTASSHEIKVESSILNSSENSMSNTPGSAQTDSVISEKRVERDKSPVKDCPLSVNSESGCTGEEDRTSKNSSHCEINISRSENGPSANVVCVENMPKNTIAESGSSSMYVLNKLCVDSCGTNEQNTNSAIVKSSVNISDDKGVSDIKQCKINTDISEIPDNEKPSSSGSSGSLQICKKHTEDKVHPEATELCGTNACDALQNIEVDTPVSVETAQNSSETCNIICSNVKLEHSSSSDSICENSSTLSPQETKLESTASENAHLNGSNIVENVEKESIRPFQEPKIEIEDEGDLMNMLGQEISDSDDMSKQAEQSLVDISLVYSKPLKRKCSENAAELIKACMGVEDNPKRLATPKPRPSDEIIEKLDGEKIEENARMNLRVRRDDSSRKVKGSSCNSDCSSDEEMALSELMSKSRARERQGRTRLCNKDLLLEPNNCRPGRRRSTSSESRHGDEPKGRIVRENNKRDVKKEETIKKISERTKRGNTQDQLIGSRVIGQRSGRMKEQDVCKEENSMVNAKRKTRGTDTIDVVPVKRRRYSKDGHR